MKNSEKIQRDILKLEQKIMVLQEQLKTLQIKKREAEDAELLSMVKTLDVQPNELKEILKAIREGNLDYLLEHMDKQKTA